MCLTSALNRTELPGLAFPLQLSARQAAAGQVICRASTGTEQSLLTATEARTTVWQGGGSIWQKQKGKVWLLSGPAMGL